MRSPSLFWKLLLVSGTMAVGLTAQANLSNDDLVKLSKADLSDEFILGLINQSSSGLATDPASLAQMKSSGVKEKLISAAVNKVPPRQPVSSDDILRLQKAGFSDEFLLDLIHRQTAGFSLDASRLVELRQAGVSERVLTAMNFGKVGRDLPSGTQVSVRLIDDIDSGKAAPGDRFKASLAEALVIDGKEVAPRGADATVILTEEKEAGKLTGRTEVSIALESITIGGTPVMVQTTALEKQSASQTRSTATRAGVAGAIGAAIGAIAGGGKGAAIGAGAGAAAGAGSVLITKGPVVKLPSETVLVFALSTPASY